MPTIAFLDWFFLAVLFVSLLIGAWRGLVYELISLASWAAAFVLAQWFALDVAQQLPMAGAGESVRYAAGFALTFILALFAGGLIAAIVKNLITAVGLAPVDRVLGAAFGLVRGFVLLLAISVVVSVTPLKSSAWWAESAGGSALSLTLKGLKPVLPQDFGKYL